MAEGLTAVTGGESAPPKRRLYVGRAALLAGVFGSFVALLWSGALPCATAHYLHVACPGCGATRATKELLTLHVDRAIHLNPLGPFMALFIAAFFVQCVTLMARDGSLRAINGGWVGKAIPAAMVATWVGQLIVWIARFYGFLGGPCPV